MKLGLPWLTQIQGNVDPNQVTPTTVGGWIAQTLKVLVAGIMTAYHTEHNDDDTHKTIHASGAIFEQGRTTAAGDWIEVAPTSADFSATLPLVWLVTPAQVTTWEYMLVGHTLFLNFAITGSTESGAAGQPLTMKIPGRFTTSIEHQDFGVFEYHEGATYGVGTIIVQAGLIRLYKAARANWLGSGSLDVHGQVFFEIGG